MKNKPKYEGIGAGIIIIILLLIINIPYLLILGRNYIEDQVQKERWANVEICKEIGWEFIQGYAFPEENAKKHPEYSKKEYRRTIIRLQAHFANECINEMGHR